QRGDSKTRKTVAVTHEFLIEPIESHSPPHVAEGLRLILILPNKFIPFPTKEFEVRHFEMIGLMSVERVRPELLKYPNADVGVLFLIELFVIEHFDEISRIYICVDDKDFAKIASAK